jgi:acyl-CoA reductase-like NAD-dependent aldehyde dehydrogenase
MQTLRSVSSKDTRTTIETPAPGASSSGANVRVAEPRQRRCRWSAPTCSKADVDAAVERARKSADWWGALSFGERAHYLPTWRSVITRRIAQLSELAHLDTGKPTGDAAEDDPDLQFAHGGPFAGDST